MRWLNATVLIILYLRQINLISLQVSIRIIVGRNGEVKITHLKKKIKNLQKIINGKIALVPIAFIKLIKKDDFGKKFNCSKITVCLKPLVDWLKFEFNIKKTQITTKVLHFLYFAL